MNSLSRVMIAAWLVLGWTPHGVCTLQAGAKHVLASQPVSKGCPLCHETVNAAVSVPPCPGMPGEASSAREGVPGRNAPDSPPGKCCSPDAAVTSGKVSEHGPNEPICLVAFPVPCAVTFFVVQPSLDVLGTTRSFLIYQTVPLHLRLCVLQI